MIPIGPQRPTHTKGSQSTLSIFQDIAPRYASILMGISNVVSPVLDLSRRKNCVEDDAEEVNGRRDDKDVMPFDLD